jgi:hypothetical protein
MDQLSTRREGYIKAHKGHGEIAPSGVLAVVVQEKDRNLKTCHSSAAVKGDELLIS